MGSYDKIKKIQAYTENYVDWDIEPSGIDYGRMAENLWENGDISDAVDVAYNAGLSEMANAVMDLIDPSWRNE